MKFLATLVAQMIALSIRNATELMEALLIRVAMKPGMTQNVSGIGSVIG